MFNHPGTKLKVLAAVILLIYVVVGCLVGSLFGAATQAGDAPITGPAALILGNLFSRGANPGYTLCIIIGGLVGLLVGWINSIALYAFGALVEDVEQIKNCIKK